MGHSLGLLLMFVVFLTVGDAALSETSGVGFYADLAVGLFMVGLGGLGAYRAFQPQVWATPVSTSEPYDEEAGAMDNSDADSDHSEILPVSPGAATHAGAAQVSSQNAAGHALSKWGWGKKARGDQE
ncbi:hypothetical protein T484DRAFT_1805968, partial [Baffinella frigidus]